MRTIPLQAERRRGLRASKRLLALASDERLVDEIRAGNEAAFEVAYERHGRGVLSFSRHMLGSRDEAEEAVQHTFVAAWTDLQHNERPIRLKPWLYTIARNRCVSMLRARREQAEDLEETVATAGLAEEVAQRADLRALLADLGQLPEEQRAALVLSEIGGFSHADIAEVVGRKEVDVKGIVFRARSTLADWREARETPCDEIREQLSVLRGGALRRRTLRRHLQDCPGCRDFREHVKAQRRMMALVLPVAPTIGLKRSVLAAVGFGGGAAGGGAAGGGAAAGLGAGILGPLGGATVAKVAVVGAIAGGAITVGERALDGETPAKPSGTPAADAPKERSGSATGADGPAALLPFSGAREAGEESVGKRGKGKGRGRRAGGGSSALAPPATPVRAKGSPPALGRVRRGLAPPATGPSGDRGRAFGQQRRATVAPKPKPLKLKRTTPPPTIDAPAREPGRKTDEAILVE